jgi:hypothetical protein
MGVNISSVCKNFRATMKNHMQQGVKLYSSQKTEMLTNPIISQSFHGRNKPHTYVYNILKIQK